MCVHADTLIDTGFILFFPPVVRKSHTCSFKKEATSLPARRQLNRDCPPTPTPVSISGSTDLMPILFMSSVIGLWFAPITSESPRRAKGR